MEAKKEKLKTHELILPTYEATCACVQGFFEHQASNSAETMEQVLANPDIVDALVYTYKDVSFNSNGQETTVFEFLTRFAKDKYTYGEKGYTRETPEGEKAWSVHTNVFASLKRLRRLEMLTKNQHEAQEIDAFDVEDKWGIDLGLGFKPVKLYPVMEKEDKTSEVLELQDNYGRTFYLWRKEKKGQEIKYDLFDGVGRMTTFDDRNCTGLSQDEMNFCFANVNKDNIFNSAHITPDIEELPAPDAKKGFQKEGYFNAFGELAKKHLGYQGIYTTLIPEDTFPMDPIRSWTCGSHGAACTLEGGHIKQTQEGDIKFEFDGGKKAIFTHACGTPYTIEQTKEGKYKFSWKKNTTSKEYSLELDEQQLLLRIAKHVSFFQNKFEEYEEAPKQIDLQGLTIDAENKKVTLDPDFENPSITLGDKEYPVRSIRNGLRFELVGIKGTFTQSALCDFIEKQQKNPSVQNDINRIQETLEQERQELTLQRFFWQAKKSSKTGNYVLMLPREKNAPKGTQADRMILKGASIDPETKKVVLAQNAMLVIGKGKNVKRYASKDIPNVLSEFYYQQDNRTLTQQPMTNAQEFLAFFNKYGGRS